MVQHSMVLYTMVQCSIGVNIVSSQIERIKGIWELKTFKNYCSSRYPHFRMLCITEKICKEIFKCYDTNLCKMNSFAVRKTLMCRTEQLKKNLISRSSTYHLRRGFVQSCFDSNKFCQIFFFSMTSLLTPDHIVAEQGISHLKGNIEVVIFLNLYMKVRNCYLNRITII